MSRELASDDSCASVTQPGGLPPRLKILYITTLSRTGGWLTEALSADNASQITLDEAIGVTAGLARLRDEVFDAVLTTHEPGVLDAAELIEGLRGGGAEEPMIVLGAEAPDRWAPICYEVGADAYLCMSQTTARCLLWTVARAIERHALQRENRLLRQAERQRLEQEHTEAERLINQQRALITELEVLQGVAEPSESGAPTAVDAGMSLDALSPADRLGLDDAVRSLPLDLPERLVVRYQELLRAYVIMGAGNLSREMTTLSELLATAGITAHQAMRLHLHVLEELVCGLGNRSARHVMNRADLLILEVMVHLVEGYRQRYLERTAPPRQLQLPGFDASPRVDEVAAA